MFDTYISVELFEGGSEIILDKLMDGMKIDEKMMSTTDEDGELYKINHSLAYKEHELSPQLQYILISQDLYELQDGGFNIWIGELTKLWKEYARTKSKPDDDEIKNAMKYCGRDKFAFGGAWWA